MVVGSIPTASIFLLGCASISHGLNDLFASQRMLEQQTVSKALQKLANAASTNFDGREGQHECESRELLSFCIDPPQAG